MPTSSRAPMIRRLLVTGFAALAVLASGRADAGGGTTPATIAPTMQADLEGVTQAAMTSAAAKPVPIYIHDASAPTNPEGISLIRGNNHKIARKSAGQPLDLVRAVGDADGSIVVVYRSGLARYIREINPDNSLGFDVYKPGDSHAGAASDGAGGAYLVTHRSYAPPGSAIADQTKHATIHYSPDGTVLWDVEQPPVQGPYSSGQHRSVAARSNAGVFVGYAVRGRNNEPKPMLMHIAAADGATIYAREGVLAPKVVNGAVVPGAVGTGKLSAYVEHLVAASDGSLLATMHDNGHEQYIVRLDATGQQTAIFVCDGAAEPIQPQEIACVSSAGPTFSVTRYGIKDGNLAVTAAKWTAPEIEGWTYTARAGTPGRQMLVAARNGNALAMALLSKTGTLVKKVQIGGDRTLTVLGADSSKWAGAGAEAVVLGTYSLGGALPAVTQPAVAPTAVRKPAN